MAAGAIIGVAGAAAAAVGLTSPDKEEKEKDVAPTSVTKEEEITSAAPLTAEEKGKGPEQVEASPFDEPEEAAVQPGHAGTEAYQSRAMPEEDEADESDGDLPPIRDVDRPEEASDSDSDDGSNTVEDAPAASHGAAAVPTITDSEPTSSAPGQSLYENQNEAGDLASSSRAVNLHNAAPSGITTTNDKAVPGAFPGSAPSSVGDADEAFEDARSSSAFNTRSVSPPSTAGRETFGSSVTAPEQPNFAEPVAPVGSAIVVNQPISASSGFDNAFGSPFEATSPVNPGGNGVEGLPSTTSAAAAAPIGHVEGLPQSSMSRTGDDFDDFEDLTP